LLQLFRYNVFIGNRLRLNPRIARHLILPLHERLLGRKTLPTAAQLEWSQWNSPDELQTLRRGKLRAILDHAATHTVFYRQRLGESGVDLGRVDPFEVLKKLPVLDKHAIRQSITKMLWREAPGGLFECSTGGSTGEPLTFYVDRRRQACDQAARIRTHRWFGVAPGDRELYLWGSPIETSRTDRVKRFRDGLFNHLLLSAFEMSPQRMDRYVAQWNRFRPVSLFGYPSSIALLVQHAKHRNIDLDRRALKAVFVTGEVCLPEDREAIEAFFAVAVADCYGSRDAGFITHQCPQGSMHVMAEHVVVEVMRNGLPVAVGQEGEIVVTHLDNYVMPLIRYRTGDVGRLLPGRCACGRGLPLMDVINGRTTDFLYLPDGTVKHALSIIYPLRATPGIKQFRVTQGCDYGVVVDVVCDDRVARVSLESVRRKVRPVLGDSISLDVRRVERIPASRSGKYRYVISRASANCPTVEPKAQRYA